MYEKTGHFCVPLFCLGQSILAGLNLMFPDPNPGWGKDYDRVVMVYILGHGALTAFSSKEANTLIGSAHFRKALETARTRRTPTESNELNYNEAQFYYTRRFDGIHVIKTIFNVLLSAIVLGYLFNVKQADFSTRLIVFSIIIHENFVDGRLEYIRTMLLKVHEEAVEQHLEEIVSVEDGGSMIKYMTMAEMLMDLWQTAQWHILAFLLKHFMTVLIFSIITFQGASLIAGSDAHQILNDQHDQLLVYISFVSLLLAGRSAVLALWFLHRARNHTLKCFSTDIKDTESIYGKAYRCMQGGSRRDFLQLVKDYPVGPRIAGILVDTKLFGLVAGPTFTVTSFLVAKILLPNLRAA